MAGALPPPVVLLTSPAGGVAAGQSALARGVALVRFTGPTMSVDVALSKSLQELAQSLRDVGAQALGNPYAASALVRNVAFAANTPTLVAHYLGRPVTTWCINRPRPPLTSPATSLTALLVWEKNPQPSNADANTQIQLQATAACIVDLLFA